MGGLLYRYCYFYFFTPPYSVLVDSSAKCQSDDLSIPFSFFTLVLVTTLPLFQFGPKDKKGSNLPNPSFNNL